MSKKFNKNKITDYVFFMGRNKYDHDLWETSNKNTFVVKNTTDKKLEWNVFLPRHLLNSDMAVVNVFELNWVMNGHLYQLAKITDREKFDYELRSWMMNQLWSRCQYEVMINETQVDVYTQVMINWFHFEKYCWEHRKLFKQFRPEHERNEKVARYWRKK